MIREFVPSQAGREIGEGCSRKSGRTAPTGWPREARSSLEPADIGVDIYAKITWRMSGKKRPLGAPAWRVGERQTAPTYGGESPRGAARETNFWKSITLSRCPPSAQRSGLLEAGRRTATRSADASTRDQPQTENRRASRRHIWMRKLPEIATGMSPPIIR